MSKINLLYSKLLILFSLFFLTLAPQANILSETLNKPATEEQTILPVEQVFQNRFSEESGLLTVSWNILPKHYLYRDKFKFELPSNSDYKLGSIQYPAPTPKTMDGDVYQVYQNSVTIEVPIQKQASSTFPADNTITIEYQGCAESGFCYPPIKVSYPLTKQGVEKTDTSDALSIQALLETNRYWVIVTTFFLIGLGLTFTPCVLPMLPILSSIIIGERKRASKLNAFLLSTTYVTAMTLTFAISGVIAALAGNNLMTLFQSPWSIAFFSTLFFFLGLSMFDLFHIKLPHFIEQQLHGLHRKQSNGSYIGAFMMGVLSTLVVSPCLTPPLAGSLLYISDTGDTTLGGLALFAMGVGMGIPLILIGTFEGFVLPKSGVWLKHIKALFGFVLFGMAVWLLDRIIDDTYTLALWGVLAIGLSMFLKHIAETHRKASHVLRFLGLLLFIKGVIFIVGSTLGNTSITNPLEGLKVISGSTSNTQNNVVANFEYIQSIDDFKASYVRAKSQNQAIIVDTYADWCTTCQIIQKNIFKNSDTIALLKNKNIKLLKLDLTQDSESKKALMKHLTILGPPTLLFFNRNGIEISKFRTTGNIEKNQFDVNVHEISKP